VRIGQTINNLIGNAVKFSPDGGVIRIDLYAEGDLVYFSVTDEGIGIPADKKHLIFDRFYQVDASSSRRFKGAGIGLSLVKRFVQAHDGRIWVESELGKGSAFHVALPIGDPSKVNGE
jgi:signal transduction histidine kinase